MQIYTSQNFNSINYTGRNVFQAIRNRALSDNYKRFSPDVVLEEFPSEAIPKKPFNITRPHVFSHKISSYNTYVVEFNPNMVGQLKDRATKKPIDVYIIRTHESTLPDFDGFHFVDKDLNYVYGYVELSKKHNNARVDWLENKNEEKICGVGKLADKLEVKYCEENNLSYDIVSTAVPSSLISHYKRGKRFKRPEKGSEEREFLKTNYGTTNLNKILKSLINESEEKHEKVDLSVFAGYMFDMYMPKSLIKKYAEKTL